MSDIDKVYETERGYLYQIDNGIGGDLEAIFDDGDGAILTPYDVFKLYHQLACDAAHQSKETGE